ncbi:MAG: hypothetical protein ACREXY_05580, partial [Gammaproteobacteria bacterium]
VIVAREGVWQKEFGSLFMKGLNTLLEQTGQWEVATDLADTALEISNHLDNSMRAVLFLQRGKHRQTQGRLDEAIADFEQCLQTAEDLGDPVLAWIPIASRSLTDQPSSRRWW